MTSFDDVKIGDSDYEISLTKLIGKKIADICGYITTEFGDMTFQITSLVLEDSSEMGFEGEHELPYLVDYPGIKQPNFDQDTLKRIYDEKNKGEL